MNVLQNYDAFVNRVKDLDIMIDHQLLKAERLQSILERATSIWVDFRVCDSNRNKREKRLAELDDIKITLDGYLVQRDQAEQEIISFFNSVLDPDAAEVLILKYIFDKSISEIAEKQHYSYSGAASKIYRSEAKARAAFDQKKTDS